MLRPGFATLLIAWAAAAAAADRPGVPPIDPWTCPPSHPIKGYLSEARGRVYHVPGGRFYEEASPERCYASEDEARRDGGVPADSTTSARLPDLPGCPIRPTSRRSS